MTVGELLHRMSSAEIEEWKIIFQLEAAESHNDGQVTTMGQ